MSYLNEDGKNTFKCVRCKKIKYWYEFPLLKRQPAKPARWWQDTEHKIKSQRTCLKCEQIPIRIKIKQLMSEASARNMNSLREKLFDTMDGLQSKSVTVAEAKAICEVAQVIINTAKVEIDFIKAIGAKKGGDFIQILD